MITFFPFDAASIISLISLSFAQSPPPITFPALATAIFLDLFLQASLIDKMDWRASQPLNNLLSKEFQWSESSKSGFWGDGCNMNGGGGVEAAMNSSFRLVKLLNRN